MEYNRIQLRTWSMLGKRGSFGSALTEFAPIADNLMAVSADFTRSSGLERYSKVYSDKFMRIEQEDKIITGIGFESNQDMTQYKIFNSQGIFPVSDALADTTRTVQGDSARGDVSQIDSIKSN